MKKLFSAVVLFTAIFLASCDEKNADGTIEGLTPGGQLSIGIVAVVLFGAVFFGPAIRSWWKKRNSNREL